MKKKYFTYLLLCIVMLQACVERHSVENQSRIDVIESQLDSLMNEPRYQNFKGSVLITISDSLGLQKTYGYPDSSSNQAFWVGSISKPFTAAAILKLQEENKLSVNDSLNMFFKDVPSDKLGITIHHLLTHSSGLGNNYVSDGITERKHAVEAIFSSKLDHEIGKEYSYSVEGYNLLAIIIELVSGETFEEYLTNNIFRPAQLKASGFWGFEDSRNVAIAPWNNPKSMENFAPTIISGGNSYPNYGFKGATGIYSTNQDLSKWVYALRNKKILNQESLDLMFHPYVRARGNLTDGVYYGYGWFIEYRDGTLREVRHMGVEDEGIGHNGIIRFYENNNQMVVLSNAGIFHGEGNLDGVEWGIVLSFDLRDIIESD